MRRFFMSRSEFRYNKKRKHYAYLFKDVGTKRMNILITSKRYVLNKKGRVAITNVPLFKHPNKKKNGQYYLIPRRFLDELLSFDEHIYLDWSFAKNDKRKVKRIKKKKWK